MFGIKLKNNVKLSESLNMDKKRCGSCGYWEREVSTNRGTCLWLYRNKIPLSVYTLQSYMFDEQGSACQCWIRIKTKKSNKNKGSI